MKRLLFAVLLVAVSGLAVLVTSAGAQTDVYEPVVLADSPIAYFRLDDPQCATLPCVLVNEILGGVAASAGAVAGGSRSALHR